jgi:hypothetical protein
MGKYEDASNVAGAAGMAIVSCASGTIFGVVSAGRICVHCPR